MSFNNSFRPFEEKPSFWKELLIATLPAFVASVMPPVVMHFLEKGKHDQKDKKDEKNP